MVPIPGSWRPSCSRGAGRLACSQLAPIRARATHGLKGVGSSPIAEAASTISAAKENRRWRGSCMAADENAAGHTAEQGAGPQLGVGPKRRTHALQSPIKESRKIGTPRRQGRSKQE